MKVILSINAGSSSVKISVYTSNPKERPHQLAELNISGLTAPPCKLKYVRNDSVIEQKDLGSSVKTQGDAFEILLQTLIDDAGLPEIGSAKDISIACHRIVHGGDYKESKILTKETYHHLEELSDLAPLHNGSSLVIVDQCLDKLSSTINVACFDTQFHRTIPPFIFTYPIDQGRASKNQLRKYGFHGISYSFITRSVADFLQKDASRLNIIALHLGSGASACAIKNGKSWDTSMGLTPLSGLPGATRSGSVDPSLVFHYTSDASKLAPASTQHLHISKAEEILNKQSGWKALTGTTDFKVIAESDKDEHKLAFDLFVNRVCNFVGSYFVSLEGQVDALVFSGGIGERNAKIRNAIVGRANCLGFYINDKRNETEEDGVVQDVGDVDAKRRVLVCRTDEQFEMAHLCTTTDGLWD